MAVSGLPIPGPNPSIRFQVWTGDISEGSQTHGYQAPHGREVTPWLLSREGRDVKASWVCGELAP